MTSTEWVMRIFAEGVLTDEYGNELDKEGNKINDSNESEQGEQK